MINESLHSFFYLLTSFSLSPVYRSFYFVVPASSGHLHDLLGGGAAIKPLYWVWGDISLI